MSRSVPEPRRATETVTVRVPKGTADKVRAATGQPFSKIVRDMVSNLLERFASDVQPPAASDVPPPAA